MTDLEKIDALISGKSEAPERIYGWLDTQMSIARHYGGLKYMGHYYYVAYKEDKQPLVRADAFKREEAEAKAREKAERHAAKAKQGDLL